jgi:hypothetical protein
MGTNNLSNLAKILAGRISENSPTILTGLAVAGLISTTILAVKATPKAQILLDLEQQRREINENRCDLPSKWEIIKLTWKCYIPTCAVGLATCFCIVQANSIHLRRSAALAGLYSITESAFKEYQSKVVETIGRNKELKVRDDISADRIRVNPSGSNEIIFTGKGEVLCYDSLTGRYFKSSIEHIKQSLNALNKQLMNDMFITLNELYYELGLSGTSLGESLGWDVGNGLIEVNFSTQLSENGEPCLVLNYEVFPKFVS